MNGIGDDRRRPAGTAWRWTLLACLASLAPAAVALPGDRQAVARLEAGQAEFDEQRGIGVYQDAVHYRQGTLNLWADRLVVHSRDGELVRIVAHGQPARLTQRLVGDETDARAEARTIEYDLVAGRLILRGDGHMWRDDDEFIGDLIVYDEASDTVKAKGRDDGQRVRIIIHPKGQETRDD